MARFIGRIEGSGAEVTRLGSPGSGMRAEALGWNLGVQVFANVDGDEDVFEVYICGGSNGRTSREHIGTAYYSADGIAFTPYMERAALKRAGTPRKDFPEPYIRGWRDGKAAGSWVIDGNTTREAAARIIRGYEDGDPEILDMQPSPLSGEWAGDLTPADLAAEQPGLTPEDVDELCGEYEQGYAEGYWREVIASARAIA